MRRLRQKTRSYPSQKRNKTRKVKVARLGPLDALPLMCQCPGCNRNVNRGDTFCNYHKTTPCKIKSPLSGYEPAYAPEEYNGDKAIQHSHNCFAYAMNVKDQEKIKKCREENECRFHSPGRQTGHSVETNPDSKGIQRKTCSIILGGTISDSKGHLTTFDAKCKPGYSKVAVVVDAENDFHYYRQDNNGMWSHKPGGREVTNKDAVGALIYNPERASRYYPKENENDSGLNYRNFCSFMCVPRDNSIKIGGRRMTKKNIKIRRR